jgi:hypothetical protein
MGLLGQSHKILKLFWLNCVILTTNHVKFFSNLSSFSFQMSNLEFK